MRRVVLLGVALALVAPVAGAATVRSVTPWQVTTAFKRATGDKLVVDRRASWAGHYTALGLGAVTIAGKARYGSFTVFVVAGGDVEADVTDLLADGHTGVLGPADAAGIRWESGRTIHGDRFWLAKRRYGSNVVLWWTGSVPSARRTDAAFRRLHAALQQAAR